MASAFFGGFANSIAGQMDEQRRRQSEMIDYETKLRKTAELEEQLRKTRQRDEPEFFEKDGQVYVQPVNQLGEELGPPRLATPGQAEAHKQKMETIRRTIKKDETSIRAAEVSIKADEAKLANIPVENELQKQQVANQRMSYGASAAEAASRTALNKHELAARKRIIDLVDAGREVPPDLMRAAGQAVPAGRSSEMSSADKIKAEEKANELLGELEDRREEMPPEVQGMYDAAKDIPDATQRSLQLLKIKQMLTGGFKSVIGSFNSQDRYAQEDEMLARLRAQESASRGN